MCKSETKQILERKERDDSTEIAYERWADREFSDISHVRSTNKAFLVRKFGRKCWICGNKVSKKKIELHHKEYLSNGGKDKIENYMIVCDTCHDEIHDGNICKELIEICCKDKIEEAIRIKEKEI
jgi:5-methylcytosine-specific restriction endonuclease McrA